MNPSFPKAIWNHWTRATRAIGVAQTRLLMLLVYISVVLPTGLLFRMFKDPLHLKHPADTNWVSTKCEKPTIDRARQQF